MKIPQIGSIVRFIYRNVNWQGTVMHIERPCPALNLSVLSVAVEGYPNMLSVPNEMCIVL